MRMTKLGTAIIATNEQLTAPFPYFGGKRKVAQEVWRRFGDPKNYVEPFAGSLAVLLARPSPPKIETVNDLDGMIANFWRAVQAAPDDVASHADWPVNENDLQARHYWLVTEGRARLAACLGDPGGYDALVAGWWVWGICAWIGGGWCAGDGPWWWLGTEWGKIGPKRNRTEAGVSCKRPHLGDGGRGINRQLPHLGSAGRREYIRGIMNDLSARLRDVRVCSGNWSRVCGPSVTDKNGLTCVFLDPPYNNDLRDSVYTEDNGDCAADVRRWAIENGKNPLLRIALCGYTGEHVMPDDWVVFAWKTQGGYGNHGNKRGRSNKNLERIWFSPHCLKPADHDDSGLLS